MVTFLFDIELLGVSKTYAGNKDPAVNDINLQVEQGKIITLLGPSGCGKTTTLRLIAGFERPEKGTILLAGKVVIANDGTWVPPEKRGVGMVFQDYALFPHLSVWDNVAFGLKKGVNKKNRVLDIMKLVGLVGLENRYPHELSGGQQQRVALARAIAPKPVVVMLDEPFSNLDAELRKYVRQEIREIIKTEGITAFFVTHDQKDALAISDRIVVMKEGQIEQYDIPERIYQFPATEFVASFIGQANILKGIIGKNEASVETEIGIIPCRNIYGLPSGQPVKMSIRPEGFELNPCGEIRGILKKMVYSGSKNEGIVEVKTSKGHTIELLVHLYPEADLSVGMVLNFKVLPNFAAVIK